MPATPTFEDHYLSSLQGLGHALTELLFSVGADPSQPQEAARLLGLNRNLTWKISRVACCKDPFEVFNQVPGSAALEGLLRAVKKRGASAKAMQDVRRASAEIENMVELHVGDRPTMELMLESLAASRSAGALLNTSRKLAFRGNSGIWGAQAKLRLRLSFLAPNAERSDSLDVAQVNGLIGLRRFRPDVVLPLFNRSKFNDDGSVLHADERPLEPANGDSSEAMLMSSFCSPANPPLKLTQHARGILYEQASGALGNRGTSSIVFGSLSRNFAPRYRDAANSHGEIMADVCLPVENLLCDLIVHESLAEDMQLETCHYQGDPHPSFQRGLGEFQGPERIQEIVPSAFGVTTPLMPRYAELVQATFDAGGWNPAEFRVMRFELRYPVVPSTVVLRFPLQERPT